VKEQPNLGGARLTAEQAASLAGIYWNHDDDAFIKITAKGSTLQANSGREEMLVLKPVGAGRFHIADVPWGDQVEIRFVSAISDKRAYLFCRSE
jgi:hypothetical protein